MNAELRLNQVADRYRAQGYNIVIRPRPDDLPAFAKDFSVEIIARRDDGGVLASASRRDCPNASRRVAGGKEDGVTSRYDPVIHLFERQLDRSPSQLPDATRAAGIRTATKRPSGSIRNVSGL
jgi:hypothetical protein